eukprot:gene1197-1379_t
MCRAGLYNLVLDKVRTNTHLLFSSQAVEWITSHASSYQEWLLVYNAARHYFIGASLIGAAARGGCKDIVMTLLTQTIPVILARPSSASLIARPHEQEISIEMLRLLHNCGALTEYTTIVSTEQPAVAYSLDRLLTNHVVDLDRLYNTLAVLESGDVQLMQRAFTPQVIEANHYNCAKSIFLHWLTPHRHQLPRNMAATAQFIIETFFRLPVDMSAITARVSAIGSPTRDLSTDALAQRTSLLTVCELIEELGSRGTVDIDPLRNAFMIRPLIELREPTLLLYILHFGLAADRPLPTGDRTRFLDHRRDYSYESFVRYGTIHQIRLVHQLVGQQSRITSQSLVDDTLRINHHMPSPVIRLSNSRAYNPVESYSFYNSPRTPVPLDIEVIKFIHQVDGSFRLVQHLPLTHNTVDTWKYMIKNGVTEAPWDEACTYGFQDILRLCLDRGLDPPVNLSRILLLCCNDDIFDLFQSYQTITMDNDDLWMMVGESGCITTYEWLSTKSEPRPLASLASAVRHGQLDLIRHIQDTNPTLAPLPLSFKIGSIMHGHLDTLDYLLSTSAVHSHDLLVKSAIIHGQIQVIEYLVSSCVRPRTATKTRYSALQLCKLQQIASNDTIIRALSNHSDHVIPYLINCGISVRSTLSPFRSPEPSSPPKPLGFFKTLIYLIRLVFRAVTEINIAQYGQKVKRYSFYNYPSEKLSSSKHHQLIYERLLMTDHVNNDAQPFIFFYKHLASLLATTVHAPLVQLLHTRYPLYFDQHAGTHGAMSNDWIIDSAAKAGSVAIVGYLHGQRFPASTMAMDNAAAHGHLSLVEFLHESRTEGCTTTAMDAAAAGGHIEVLSFLAKHRTEGFTSWAIRDACKSNRTNVLELMISLKPATMEIDFPMDLVTSSNLNMVMILHKAFPNIRITSQALDRAAGSGNLDVVRYLHTVGVTASQDAFNDAAARGHVNVLHFLHVNRSDGYSAIGLIRAAANGHLETLAFLLNIGYTLGLQQAFLSAVTSGHMECVLHMYAINPRLEINSDVFRKAAATGDLSLVIFLLETGRVRPDNHAVNDAARNGKYHVLGYLLSKYPDLRVDDNAIIMVKADQVEEVRTLLNEYRFLRMSHMVLINACMSDEPSVVELYMVPKYNPDDVPHSITQCIRHGSLRVFQWFHEHHPSGFGENIFNQAAEFGALEIVKWLHINTSVGCNRLAMDMAAQRGHLEVVQIRRMLKKGNQHGMLWRFL